MKNRWIRGLLAAAAALLLVAGTGAAFADTADTDGGCIAYDGLETVSLAAHTSYVTKSYASVVQLKSSDGGVAAATVDTRGRVVVTALGEGEATISFRYKTSQTAAGWVGATLPVRVSGKAEQAASVSSVTAGLVIQGNGLPLSVGEQGTPGFITLNGTPVSASDLLWASSNESVLTVEANTGAYHAVSAGTSSLCAVTPDGKWSTAVSITVQ